MAAQHGPPAGRCARSGVPPSRTGRRPGCDDEAMRRILLSVTAALVWLGVAAAPDSAKNAKVGDTDWEKISSDPVARWHDHRIHWMLPTNPSTVQASPGRRHVVIPEWVVAMRFSRGTPPDPRGSTQPIAVKGDLVWEPGSSALPWYGLVVALAALVVVIGRRPGWAPGLAAVTAVVVAVDIFHAVGLGLANAGGLGYRLTKSITQ